MERVTRAALAAAAGEVTGSCLNVTGAVNVISCIVHWFSRYIQFLYWLLYLLTTIFLRRNAIGTYNSAVLQFSLLPRYDTIWWLYRTCWRLRHALTSTNQVSRRYLYTERKKELPSMVRVSMQKHRAQELRISSKYHFIRVKAVRPRYQIRTDQ